MRVVTLAIAVVLGAAHPGSAQSGASTPSPQLPAAGVPSPEPAVLPGGTDVSRPLQPVVETPPPAEPPPPAPTPGDGPSEASREPRPGKVLGDWWDTDEFLLWWPKTHPVPPLVTGTRDGPPVLGREGTALLVGGQAIDRRDVAGYRLTYGFSLNAADTVGFEGRYFFLGSRTLSASATDLGGGRLRTLGLPYVDAQTGREEVLTVARPGVSSALVSVFTTTRVQGAEANVVGNLYAGPGAKVHALVGYRFAQVNEGLRVEQRWLQYPTPESGNYKTLGLIADQFDAHNEFHGGQLGLLADLHRGPVYVELTGKVAVGTNYQVVTVDGATHLITAASPVPLLQSFTGGVYAQPSNIGRVTRTAFAVVPEGTVKVGLKLGDHGRIFVGYNVLYLSDAVRPGDQVDRVLNPTQIPLLGRGTAASGPDRPRVVINHTDFWTQGLVIGLEGRF